MFKFLRFIAIVIIVILLTRHCTKAQVLFGRISNLTTEADITKWSDTFKLRIIDFTPVKALLSGRVASANTGIIMDYNYLKTGRFRAYSIWTRSESILVDTLTGENLDEVLIHEQGHFAITEYITRCLNTELIDIHDIKIADKIYYDYLRKLENMQKLYDMQTDHYNNKYSQLRWNEMIIKLLKKPSSQY